MIAFYKDPNTVLQNALARVPAAAQDQEANVRWGAAANFGFTEAQKEPSIDLEGDITYKEYSREYSGKKVYGFPFGGTQGAIYGLANPPITKGDKLAEGYVGAYDALYSPMTGWMYHAVLNFSKWDSDLNYKSFYDWTARSQGLLFPEEAWPVTKVTFRLSGYPDIEWDLKERADRGVYARAAFKTQKGPMASDHYFRPGDPDKYPDHTWNEPNPYYVQF